jgi:hypothetical protein
MVTSWSLYQTSVKLLWTNGLVQTAAVGLIAASAHSTGRWLVASLSLLREHPVDSRPTDTQSSGYRARGLAASVHPLGQGSIWLAERPWPPDWLPTRPTRLSCRCAAFSAKFQLKFGE